jgi:hypothetical protein
MSQQKIRTCSLTTGERKAVEELYRLLADVVSWKRMYDEKPEPGQRDPALDVWREDRRLQLDRAFLESARHNTLAGLRRWHRGHQAQGIFSLVVAFARELAAARDGEPPRKSEIDFRPGGKRLEDWFQDPAIQEVLYAEGPMRAAVRLYSIAYGVSERTVWRRYRRGYQHDPSASEGLKQIFALHRARAR